MLRGRGVGTVATAGAIGAVVGPLIAIAAGGGASVLGIARSAGPFLAVPLLGVVAVWLIARMHPDPREVASDLRRWYRKLPPIPEPPPPRRRAELLRLGPARAAITATALGQAAMVGVMAITSVELGDHGWADWQVQLLMAAHFVGMFALAYPVGMLADRIGRRRTSLLGLGACAVGAFGTAVTGASPLITPFFFLLGLGWAGCFVAGTSILADITSARERGVLTASNDLIVALCAAVGIALRRRAALGRRLLGRRRRLRDAARSRGARACCGCRSPRSACTSRRRQPSWPAGRLGAGDPACAPVDPELCSIPRLAGRHALDQAPHGVCVGGDALAALGALVQVGERRRQRRRDAGGALDRFGELGRMGRRERDQRRLARGRARRGPRSARRPCAGRAACRCGGTRRASPRASPRRPASPPRTARALRPAPRRRA